MTSTGIMIPPAKYTREAELHIQWYGDGTPALVLYCNGERVAKASVNMGDYIAEPLPHGEVWLKGWSENDGLPEAMERAGAVKRTGRTHPAGFAEAQHAELTAAVLEKMGGLNRG